MSTEENPTNGTAKHIRSFVAESYSGVESAAVWLLASADTIEGLAAENERLAVENAALIEYILDHDTLRIPDDGEPEDGYAVVECWYDRIKGDDQESYATKEEAIRAVRRAAGIEDKDEATAG